MPFANCDLLINFMSFQKELLPIVTVPENVSHLSKESFDTVFENQMGILQKVISL